MKTGKGLLVLSNGEKYEGEFGDDTPNGQGRFTNHRGEIIEGVWKDGVLAQS